MFGLGIKHKLKRVREWGVYQQEKLIAPEEEDAYHLQLRNWLKTTYQLSGGQWILGSKEIANLQDTKHYGGYYRLGESKQTVFTKVVRGTSFKECLRRFDVTWSLQNKRTIRKGDKVLFILNIRAPKGRGKGILLVEDKLTYRKEAFIDRYFDEDWRQFLIPFEATKTFIPNTLRFAIHKGYQAQTLEIGGCAAINYGREIPLTSLPKEIHVNGYEGDALDAPWRAQAAKNITKYRKANLAIRLVDKDGMPVKDALLKVKMLQHEFNFGTGVQAKRLLDKNTDDKIYKEQLINLDGCGHGFNEVFFDNSLKWSGWEEEWFLKNKELIQVTQWLKENHIKSRGTSLFWGNDTALPKDVKEQLKDTKYVQERIFGHLETMLLHEDLKDTVQEWVALNELSIQKDLEDVFKGKKGYETGQEIYAEILHKAKALNPQIGLWIDETVLFTYGAGVGDLKYEWFIQTIQGLLDAKCKIEGIGTQAHIKADLASIPKMLEVFDDLYNRLGLKNKISEFDMCSLVDEQVAAQYLRDFMTATFSHKSMTGFITFNFWDGATFMNKGANLFRKDWQLTPAGQAYIDLVFKEWWTNEILSTSESGKIETCVFKGLYEIAYESNGEEVKKVVQISEDTTLDFVVNNPS